MSCVDCGTRGKVCPVNGIRIQGARPPTHRLLPTIRLSDGSHQLTGQGLGIGVAPYGLPALPQNLGPTIPGDYFQAGIPVSRTLLRCLRCSQTANILRGNVLRRVGVRVNCQVNLMGIERGYLGLSSFITSEELQGLEA
jgi:hypothetical protein